MNAKAPQEHEEILAADGREFTCLFRSDASGGYLVTCDEMPPMIAYGETLAEARAQAEEDLTGWIDACDNIREGPLGMPR